MTVLTLVIMTLISVSVIYSNYTGLKKTNQEKATSFMLSSESRLQYAIESRILVTDIMEMVVITHNGEVVDFEENAALLYSGDPAIRCIQLAPEGVVTYVYPLEGNENAYGNLLENPIRKAEAIKARDSGETTLAGPYELTIGGMGMVARNPIYLPDENGNEQFWGFSIVVFSVPEIFNYANLDLFDSQDYDYRLWRYRPNTGEVQVIATNTDAVLTDPISEVINVPNSTWHLEMQPKDGWVPTQRFVLWIAVFIALTVLITLAVFAVLTIVEQQSSLVEQHEKLIRLTNTDVLTDLKNTRYFLNRIKELAADNTAFGLFYLDMNNFKQVNDNYGHDEGDKLLVETAKRIEACVQDMGFAARMGGDEFSVIITKDENEEFFTNLKQRTKESVGQTYVINGIAFHPQISIGFARYPSDSSNIEEIIRMADGRMYAEKHGTQ